MEYDIVETFPFQNLPNSPVREYFIKGTKIRYKLNGPAVESIGGITDEEYWIEGVQYSKEKFDILNFWFQRNA